MSAALAIFSAFLYAVSMVFARVGLKSGNSFAGGVISMGFSFAGSLIIFFYIPIERFAGWAVLFFMLAGLSGPCLGRFMLFVGINRVGSSVASTIYAVKPMFSAAARVSEDACAFLSAISLIRTTFSLMVPTTLDCSSAAVAI